MRSIRSRMMVFAESSMTCAQSNSNRQRTVARRPFCVAVVANGEATSRASRSGVEMTPGGLPPPRVVAKCNIEAGDGPARNQAGAANGSRGHALHGMGRPDVERRSRMGARSSGMGRTGGPRRHRLAFIAPGSSRGPPGERCRERPAVRKRARHRYHRGGAVPRGRVALLDRGGESGKSFVYK